MPNLHTHSTLSQSDDRDKKRPDVHFASVEEVCRLSGSAHNSLSAHAGRPHQAGYAAQRCGFVHEAKEARITKRDHFMWP